MYCCPQSYFSLQLLASDCRTTELYSPFYVAPLHVVIPGSNLTWTSLGQVRCNGSGGHVP